MVNEIYANIASFYVETQEHTWHLHKLHNQSSNTGIPRQFSETRIRENVP
ncbi:hypothetical protein U14_04915 [Candidatus Moduliflexus flocculans]|uniref:Uncharacterized protein n=1 Tax=Candidatus Moduliflexus flocculans TaxID=1499966 RepID=A0A0S6W1I8_9BACT|nr:hypothetical protein U14_04915 [Candidatus Moduliflexus flocculans]